MGRIAWAFVGLACGGVVAGLVAFVQMKDFGHLNLKWMAIIFVLVALAVLTIADQSGWIAEAEAPPQLSLGPDSPESEGGGVEEGEDDSTAADS